MKEHLKRDLSPVFIHMLVMIITLFSLTIARRIFSYQL